MPKKISEQNKNISNKSVSDFQKESSAISLSSLNKTKNKLRLSTILQAMQQEFPLVDFAEKLETETSGKFTELTLCELLDKYYTNLSQNDKLFLTKHLPMSSVSVTPYSPLISLLYLFKYFENILHQRIYSPSLIFYKVAEKLKYKFNQTTLEFIQSINLNIEKEITMNEFYSTFANKMQLDNISSIVIFKAVDIEKKNKIKVENLVLVIDSYRDDNLDEKINTSSLSEETKFLRNFLDKNFISMDKIYETAEYNYLPYNEIKNILLNETYINQRLFNEKEKNITINLIENVLNAIKRKDKIFKEEFNNYLGQSFLENLKNEKENINLINLDLNKLYWINKYLCILNSAKITPKMSFDSSTKEPNKNIAKIPDLLRKLALVSNHQMSQNELKYLMNAIDVNTTGLIEYNQYIYIMEYIEDIKKKIEEFFNKDENNKNKNMINNIWSNGIKSENYHLLPVKGNSKILENLLNDINKNLLNNEDDETENIKLFEEEKKIKGDEGAICEEKNPETGEIVKYYSNAAPSYDMSNEMSLEKIIENFEFDKFYFPTMELFKYLRKNNFKKEDSFNIIRYIDSNNDGYISVIELMDFLLKDMKYCSTKLVLKYLYIKIYKELNLSSSEIFFKINKFNIQKNINISKLAKLFKSIYIQTPITNKLYEDMKYLYKPPIIYFNLCQLIDEYKNNSILNNFCQNQSKEETANIISFNINIFDNEMRNLVISLLDVKKFNYDDEMLLCRNLQQNLGNILNNCEEKMNLSQYNLNFANKLNIKSSIANIIFHLLKTKDKSNNQYQISKNDILMFFESYCCQLVKTNSSNIDNNKIIYMIKNLENHGPPFKYAFDNIPFKKENKIFCNELIEYLNKYYNNSTPNEELTNIINYIDEKQNGYATYEQISEFLSNYSTGEEISYSLEFKIIACNLLKENINDAIDYFNNQNLKSDKITKNVHNKLLKNIYSNKKNLDMLFKYFTKRSKKSYYPLEYLTDALNAFLLPENNFDEDSSDSEDELNKENKKQKIKLPNTEAIENALQQLNLGKNGVVSICELLRNITKENRKILCGKLDPNQNGFIEFSDLVNKLRKIYGANINLNYKLCSQYLYKKYIKSPELIKNYILNKANSNDFDTYLTYDNIYNSFMFAFCNDKYLFDNFYLVYKEKENPNKNLFNLKSMLLFLYNNNHELKYLFDDDTQQTAINKKNISKILYNHITNIKQVIDKIDINNSKLSNDFSIDEQYMNRLLKNEMNFTNEEAKTICRYFRLEENKFNLRKFFIYDDNNLINKNIIIEEDIIPNIQAHIKSSNCKSYKEYKSKIFNCEFLDIFQLYSKFNLLYNTTLFQCLVLILGNNEQNLSIDNFFEENNLKNCFPLKDFDPSLKLILNRLNEYFENHKDKLKVFKHYDKDKNGVLSPEEFMTALNSLKDLNLTDSQKYKLLNIADLNKDGKVNSKEFLTFIKSIKDYTNEYGELTAAMPALYSSKKNETKYNQKYLETDISVIKENLKHNKIKYNENKNNEFLGDVIILQNNLIEKYYSEDCLEKDFIVADNMNSGFVNVNKFKVILKKRIYNLGDEAYEKLLSLAGSEGNIGKINYKNFLNNIATYKIGLKNNNSFINSSENALDNEKNNHSLNSSRIHSKTKLPKIN